MEDVHQGGTVSMHSIQALGGTAEQKQARRDQMRSLFEVQVSFGERHDTRSKMSRRL
jgi:hypothetical protein